VGNHSIAAYYQGDSNNNISDSSGSPVSQTVNEANSATSVSLTGGGSSSIFGQSGVTFTATVTDNSAGSSGTPAGTVSFSYTTNGVAGTGAALGSAVTLSSGSATSVALPTTLPVGAYTITAAFNDTDGDFNNSSGTVGQTVTQTATAGNSLVSASPASVPADGATTSTITVTLKDTYGNPVPGKTVTLASSRGATDTISAASGASDSNGHVTFTVYSSTATPSGSPAVFTATDVTDGNLVITQTASVTFTAVGNPQFVVTLPGQTFASGISSGTVSSQVAGIPFDIVLTLVNSDGVTVDTNYNGTNVITYSGPGGSPVWETNVFFTNGVATNVPVTLTLAQATTITAADNVNSYAGDISSNLVVVPGAITQYAVSATTPQTAGTAFNVTVTAQDAYANTVTNDSSTAVTLGSGSGNVTFPGGNPVTPANGTFTVSANDTVAENTTITATDVNGTNGISSSITVNPTSLDHFAISGVSSPQTAGTPITGITLTAQDVYNNTVTGFAGTVVYSGTAEIVGTSSAFTAGVLSGVSVTPTVKGSGETLIVTGSGKTGTATFNVNPGAVSASHSVISASPTSITANGTSTLAVTVTEKDADNNQENGAGEVTPVLSASSGSLGALTDNGNGTFTATLTSSTTAGGATVTGTIGGTAIGTSAAVAFTPGPVDHYAVSASTPQAVAAAFNVTVTAQDANNNTVTNDSSDSVTLSGMGSATAAANPETVTAGVAIFSVTDPVTGTITITATDGNGKTGTSSSIVVGAATENLLGADATGVSALIAVTNWTPATTVAPTNVLATNYNYVANNTLRTPGGAGNYTTPANSLTITTGGTLTLKGNGTNTVNNLVMNGGEISQGETAATPDTATLAGSVNLAANATIISGATSSSTDPLTLVIQAPITNAPGTSSTLTLNDNSKAIGGLTVLLTAQNTFNGGITVAGFPGDTLKLGVNNALPSTLLLNIQGTAGSTGTTNPVFDLAGYSTVVSNLVFSTSSNSGYVTNSSTSPSTLTISNNAADTLQYGVIADNSANGGTVALTKTGNGTLTLDVANTYSGDTTVNAGTLQMGATSVLPFGVGYGNLNVNSGGTVDMSGHSTSVNGLSGNGTVDNLSGAGTYTLTAGYNNATDTFGGVIQDTSGTVALNKYGTGILYLTGNGSTFTGNVDVKTGQVWIASSSALGSGTKTVTVQDGSDAELHLNGTNGAITLASGLSFVTGNSTGNGTIINEAGNNAIDGIIEESTGGGTLITVNSGTLDLAGGITIVAATARNVTLQGEGNGTVSGVISDQDGTNNFAVADGVVKTGTLGTWTLDAVNTYSGFTEISAGTLALGSSGSINNSTNITIAAGGTFDVSAISAFALSSSMTNLVASGTASPATINGASGGTVNFGSVPVSLTYDGSHPALTISQGTLVLNGNAFTVNHAALAVGTYTIVQQSSGSISSSGSYTVTGTAIGAGKTAWISVSGGNVNLVVDYLPVANAASYSRAAGVSLMIHIADLLTNATDASGYALTLAGAGTDGYNLTTATGSKLTDDSTFIYYTNSTPVNVNDSFEYVVSDGHGGLATNTVTINVVPVTGQLTNTNSPVILTSSNATLTFFGIPGTNYDVERATNLSAPVTWVDLGTYTAPTNGVFQVIDNFTDLNSNAPPQAYWQLIDNP
jgi:adhesin/invasin